MLKSKIFNWNREHTHVWEAETRNACTHLAEELVVKTWKLDRHQVENIPLLRFNSSLTKSHLKLLDLQLIDISPWFLSSRPMNNSLKNQQNVPYLTMYKKVKTNPESAPWSRATPTFNGFFLPRPSTKFQWHQLCSFCVILQQTNTNAGENITSLVAVTSQQPNIE